MSEKGEGESVGIGVQGMKEVDNMLATMKRYGFQNTEELVKLTEICKKGQDLEGFEIRNNDKINFAWHGGSWAKVQTYYNVDTSTHYSIVVGKNDNGPIVCLVKNGANKAEILYYQKDFFSGDVSPVYSDHGEVVSSSDETIERYISLNTIDHDTRDNKKIDAFVKEVLENFQGLDKK